ncbi:MAG: DUF4258 domain-containing protein [Alphaproteobacteria bacterium]|nr:DUF4258 domain-containing protein [Alphaproteobacteria bacterium]
MNIEDKVKDLSYMTGAINMMARSDVLDLCYTEHCIARMKERNITTLDILHVLKTGIIEEYQGKAKHEKLEDIYKYKITGVYLGDEKSKREISLIILVEVDSFKQPAIKIQKIVTTMWRD